jgi:small subunit ribosomal protein S1
VNWQEFVAGYVDGTVLDGKVARVEPFGAFVELAAGIHGLLPRGQFSARQRVGSSIVVRIVTIDPARQRLTLAPVSTDG